MDEDKKIIDIEPGLRLRHLNVDDAENLFALIDNDREYLGRWVPFTGLTNTSDDSRAFIASSANDRLTGAQYGYGIELGGQLVGHISLMHILDGQDPEIGYWIASRVARRGIMTKSVIALTRFGFEVLQIDRLVIKADLGNIASNKVAQKSGFVLGGHTYDEDNNETINIWMLLEQ